jgi:hypothetical protein
MAADQSLEDLIKSVQELDRAACKERLRQMERPRLDFPDDFLDALSEERLRHLLLAACLQARKHVRRAQAG